MEIELHKRVFNPVYLPLLDDDTHRYIVLYGGAGSGKSVFAAQRYIKRMLCRSNCNILVVRKVADTNRDSTFALFRQVISDWGLDDLFDVKESLLRISCRETGNTAIFKGMDNREKIKSITFPSGPLSDIWIEEATELDEEDFKQLDVRMRGHGVKKQMVLSFNPIHALHWLKKRFFDQRDERAAVLHTTYKDNRFLDDDYIQTLEAFRDTDPYYYAVYCLGQWGVYGKTVFDAQKVAERMEHLPRPVRCGLFAYDTYYDAERCKVRIRDESIRWIDAEDGYITIWQEPQEGVPYVIGGDTSGEGSDWFVGQGINNATGEQVCTLRHQFDEDLYANQMYCLGRYYNNALLAIEVNFSTHPVRVLEELGYPKQYVRQAEDRYTHKPMEAFGYKTTKLTRPSAIARLVSIVREHSEWIMDETTLGEMLTFVRNEKGRAEAQNGAHDDCVMALAIAYFCRAQQSTEIASYVKLKRRKWTSDMWEDYRNADRETKRMLKERWGEPA